MRIGSALFAVASVLATYRLAATLAGRRAGLLSALVLLSTFHFVYLHSARTGELEPVLVFGIVMAARYFLEAMTTGGSLLPHFLAVLLVMAMKTPAVLIPLGAEALCFALVPAFRPRIKRWALTAAMVLPLGLVWHPFRLVDSSGHFTEVLATMAGEASGSGWHGDVSSNLAFYAKTVAYGAFPYSLAYLFAIPALAGSARWNDLPGLRTHTGRARAAIVYSFAAATLAFYLAVSKHYAWYVVPTYPFLSIIAAVWLVEILPRNLATAPRGPSTARTLDRLRVPWPVATLPVLALALVFLSAADDFNPFAIQAFVAPMNLRPRFDWVSDGRAIIIVAAALLAGTLGLRTLLGAARRRGSQASFAQCTAGLLITGLLIIAGLRVVKPLGHLGYQSDVALLHSRLSLSLKSGDEIDYPVRVPGGAYIIARYYFGEDFEIVPRFTSPAHYELWLFEKGDLRILDRSVSRRHIFAPDR